MTGFPHYTDPAFPELDIDTNPGRLDFDVIHGYLSRSYWSPGIPRDTVIAAVKNSIVWGLYDRGQQVGFARTVTDKATFAWLADVFVLESHHGRGLGQWLIRTVVQHPELQGLRRFLLATRDAHGLYEKVGFRSLARAERFMEIHDPEIYTRPK